MSTKTRPSRARNTTGPGRCYKSEHSFTPKAKSHKISNNGPVDPPRGGDDNWGRGGGGDGDSFSGPLVILGILTVLLVAGLLCYATYLLSGIAGTGATIVVILLSVAVSITAVSLANRHDS